ncbi:OmpA family protein [Candidatus Halobeggiatoa sp. HSG11]|nr:OmpA family protein [Candidatus Halobeggiatoa sp. HSG11]
MNKWYYLILLIAFTGCASKPEVEITPKPDKATAKTPPPIFGQDTQPTNIPTGMTTGTEPILTDDIKTAPEEKTIYFGYDMANVKVAAQIILKKHANYLIENPNLNVRLEGHADERGSTEYNLALGELRSEAAKEELLNLEVPIEQIETLSYGEESPIVSGHGEESWQLNRRVELIYE